MDDHVPKPVQMELPYEAIAKSVPARVAKNMPVGDGMAVR